MTKTKLALSAVLVFLISGCAMKGSKAEERFEGRSDCTVAGFSCGRMIRKGNDGLQPTSQKEQDNLAPSFSGGSNYAPLCRMKKDKCQCSCEPTN